MITQHYSVSCHMKHCDGTMSHCDSKVGQSYGTVKHCHMEHYDGPIEHCEATGSSMMIVLPVSANIFTLDTHDSLAILFKFRDKYHLFPRAHHLSNHGVIFRHHILPYLSQRTIHSLCHFTYFFNSPCLLDYKLA